MRPILAITASCLRTRDTADASSWVLCTDCWLPCRISGHPCDESVLPSLQPVWCMGYRGSWSEQGVCPVALSLDFAENRPNTPACFHLARDPVAVVITAARCMHRGSCRSFTSRCSSASPTPPIAQPTAALVTRVNIMKIWEDRSRAYATTMETISRRCTIATAAAAIAMQRRW